MLFKWCTRVMLKVIYKSDVQEWFTRVTPSRLLASWGLRMLVNQSAEVLLRDRWRVPTDDLWWNHQWQCEWPALILCFFFLKIPPPWPVLKGCLIWKAAVQKYSALHWCPLSLLQLSSGLIHTGSHLCQLDSWYIPDVTCSARQLIHTRCNLFCQTADTQQM